MFAGAHLCGHGEKRRSLRGRVGFSKKSATVTITFPLQFSPNEGQISKVLTKCNCKIQVFSLNGNLNSCKISPSDIYDSYVIYDLDLVDYDKST